MHIHLDHVAGVDGDILVDGEIYMSKEAMKLALEALEKLWNIIDDIDTYGDIAKADEKLYRILVERRQRTRFEETGISTDGYTLIGGAITAIKEALAQPEQEPVASIFISGIGEREFDDWGHDLPVGRNLLYTSPPAQRKPLTDEEIWQLVDGTNGSVTAFARAIEAAHGIKENT